MDINVYINDWFIHLKEEDIPISFFVIRKSLLKAVDELKTQIHGNVIDLGCGVMPYRQFLKENKAVTNYIGIDLEPTEYHGVVKPDIYWDGKQIPLADASADYVIATEFLEHYFDTAHIVREIKRILKPGGVFFFTVPCIWPVHEKPYDYHRFTPFSLTEHFKLAEFSTSVVKPLGGFHYSFALMISIWYDFKLSKSKQKYVRPIVKRLVKELVKRDKIDPELKNDQFYSGLYGFATK